MAEIETYAELAARWREEGRDFRMAEVRDEISRQARESLRERENAILAAAEMPDATDHIRAVAEQIRDHRDSGNYTTQG